ncbi:MAG: hypothetical protein ABL882_11080 [Sphingopyxis sp.]
MSPDNPLFVWLAPFWIAGWIGISIVFRLNRGKPIFPKRPDGALFYEGWASGRSLATLWGRIGGARNCLMITVTPKELIVTPRFPFNLMFLPEIYGMEACVPRSRVRIENDSAGLLKRGIIIVVDGADSLRMELMPRNKARFLKALEG